MKLENVFIEVIKNYFKYKKIKYIKLYLQIFKNSEEIFKINISNDIFI